jgi:hypothetical protein
VLRASLVESRFEAMHAGGLTALVGREESLNCSCGGGREPRPAKARWCCYPVRPGSANPGSRPR